MKGKYHFLLPLLLAAFFATTMHAQTIFEGTRNWHNAAHSAWKIEPQAMQNYVIMGNRFFSAPNNNIYVSEFSEFAQFNTWNRVHATTENLQTFWKNFCRSTYPVGYFTANGAAGNRVYAMLTNATGQKLWDRVSTLPFGVTYGGVCQATNGGYMACGVSNNSGSLAVTRFNAYGEALWTLDYPGIGFGWCIKPANGGGYVIAGTLNVTRIDIDGNIVWTRTLNPGVSPDGSAYTYGEFEEITALPEGQGFVVTASIFNNQHSGIVTARYTWAGALSWARINDEVNTGGAGTPVCWVNNAVLSNSNTKVITSWRRGPVSAGGTMFARTLNISDGTQGGIQSLANGTPVREAFATRAHGRLVIGGTPGNLQNVYAYANTVFLTDNPTPQQGEVEVPNIPNAPTLLGYQTNVFSSKPEFLKEIGHDNPVMAFATRTAYQDLSIFPNPSNGLVNVGGVLEAGATLRVFDINGRLVIEKTVASEDVILSFDLSGQPKGVYTVQMVGAQYNVTRKFVIE